MKQIEHSFHSPYGVSVPVYRDTDMPAEDERAYHLDVDGCMTLAGIYGAEDRQRCRAAIKGALGKGGVPFDIFLQHGGRQAVLVTLTRPLDPIYPTLPRDTPDDIPIDAWVTVAMDAARWDQRAAGLVHILADNMRLSEDWELPEALRAIGLQHLLTAALEHLCEKEIGHLEAAALYAVSLHKEWQGPALAWLEPLRATWFADWIAARPGYVAFATACRKADPNLPSWLAGGVE